jgi:glycosyltransferase involved in cell wall biosynthesis
MPDFAGYAPDTPRYKMTYLLSTFNKRAFLSEVLSRLIQQVKPDEEIIVIDGGSSDGTAQYLAELLRDGHIHQMVSEKDKGEAHGFNKGFLLARGELIKMLTDDDAFYWPGIDACREFMLEHPEVDLLGSDGAGIDWSKNNPVVPMPYPEGFSRWQSEARPFAFCGLGLMIRRSSLPLLGLFHIGFIRVDAEFSLRATAGPANLAWYDNPLWVRITNPDSNSVKYFQRASLESELLDMVYLNKNPLFPTALRHLKDLLRPLKRVLAGKTGSPKAFESWPAAFQMCDCWLEDANRKRKGQFLVRAGNADRTKK